MMMIGRLDKKTAASEMRHYVTIQQQGTTTDGEGGFTENWSDLYTNVPAAILPIQARQLFEYKSINVDATHLIKIRGQVSIDEKTNRIKYESRIFEILTVEDIQERGVLKILTCKEAR